MREEASMTGESTVSAALPAPTRPHMPGYGIKAEPEGMLPWCWADARLSESRNYWICTTRPDGRPHAAPVWGVWLDGALYFGSGERSVKTRNLAANPAVVAHVESGDDVVIVEGVTEMRLDLDPALFERIADVYAAKYDGFKPSASEPLFVVRPRVVFAWMEKSYPDTATRWRFAPAGQPATPPPAAR
jgi:nitroimidazol reductase NimA-like FMN-containing flavoprotein (pyridoxamine 5'-phosphate oxidase superfamily)